MAQENTVGQIPEFTSDGNSSSEKVIEEVKQPVAESTVEETATPELPAEKPAGESSVDTTEPPQVVQDAEDQKDKAISGLQTERVKLLREIADLRGQKREIKQEQINRVEQQLDELKDLNPDDVSIIERVIRSKGYVNKEEANQMFYQAVKQEEENKFFDKYPEYKVENDPDGTNWSFFEREIQRLKDLGWTLPNNPKKTFDVMEMIHKNIVKIPSGPSIPAQQRRVQVASAGAGGTQRPSSSVPFTFDADKRAMLKNGGWSEDEIKVMEAKQTR